MNFYCGICRKRYPTASARDAHEQRAHPGHGRVRRYMPPDTPVAVLPLAYWDSELRYASLLLDRTVGGGVDDVLDTIRDVRRTLDEVEAGVRAVAVTAGPRYPDGARCELCDAPAGLHSQSCPEVRAGTA